MSQFSLDLKQIGSNKYRPDPQKYLIDAESELRSAVEVAIRLGQPLLITGEPGTGKTQLAYKVAYELNKSNPDCKAEPFVFNTKTTSAASDLFYTYDAIRHFHDANIRQSEKRDVDIRNYIQLQALGSAIALSNPLDHPIREFFKNSLEAEVRSSVVLIDEIDKAPRDFPNDILSEIETYSFEVKEADNRKVTKGDQQHVIIIMTSNSEKNLPEAFLRRCVFYHIPFPSKERLTQIVQSHFGLDTNYSSDELISYFLKLRAAMRNKKPATAELLSWLRILEMKNFIFDEKIDLSQLNDKQKKILRFSFSVLAKTKDDLDSIFSESEKLTVNLN